MKTWFKYEYGFVNIDSQNIYFTNSGNWSETRALEEKGKQKPNNFRKFKIQLFLIICVILFASLFYFNILSGKISILLLVSLAISMYFIYNYMKTELGAKFKLPISKVKSIEIVESNVTINFFDADNEINHIYLEKVEEKGKSILEGLK
jgi:uncharacterized protein (DUF58 family)